MLLSTATTMTLYNVRVRHHDVTFFSLRECSASLQDAQAEYNLLSNIWPDAEVEILIRNEEHKMATEKERRGEHILHFGIAVHTLVVMNRIKYDPEKLPNHMKRAAIRTVPHKLIDDEPRVEWAVLTDADFSTFMLEWLNILLEEMEWPEIAEDLLRRANADVSVAKALSEENKVAHQTIRELREKGV